MPIMKIQLLLVLLWVSKIFGDQSNGHTIKEKFHWGILDFKFPNISARDMALATGSYIPEKNTIWGMGIWKDKIFVSLFRFGIGVASALNYFSIDCDTKSPVLIPYPSFDANYVSEDPQRPTITLPSKSSVICAGYFQIDKFDRLWISDSGYVDFFGDRRYLAKPALIIFNLKTDRLIRRYTIPDAFVNTNSVFNNLALDFTGEDCDDVFAYIIDEFRSIIVYSFKTNRSWVVVHNLFGPVPNAATFCFEQRNIQWNYGLTGITVGGRERDGSRRVYANPFTSTKSYYISNKILQNETYIALNNYYSDVHLLGDRGANGQLFTWLFDEKSNVMFDAQFYRWRVGCWNAASPYINSSFGVIYEENQVFFAADIRIDRQRNIWLLSNSLPVLLFGTWDPTVKNIRIVKGKVKDVLSGTVCELEN